LRPADSSCRRIGRVGRDFVPPRRRRRHRLKEN
jgi:hypothetical protein